MTATNHLCEGQEACEDALNCLENERGFDALDFIRKAIVSLQAAEKKLMEALP